MNAPGFKSMPLSEVQKLVMPAVVTGHFRVGQAPLKPNGPPVPVAVALWASVSDEVDRRLAQDQDAALSPNEWNSGDIPWLVAAAGDQRVLAQMLDHIQSSVLHGQKFKMRTKDSTGKIAIGSPATHAANGLAASLSR
jgi:cytolysin-activating lysine-acyltransferase